MPERKASGSPRIDETPVVRFGETHRAPPGDGSTRPIAPEGPPHRYSLRFLVSLIVSTRPNHLPQDHP